MIGRGIAFLCLLVILSGDIVHAQVSEIAQPTENEPSNRTPAVAASVKIDGKALFEVLGTRSFPAKKRAAAIEIRIIEAAESDNKAGESVTVRREGTRHSIYAGQTLIMILTEPDAALEGVTMEHLEELRRIQIQENILSYKHDRTSAAITKGVLFTLLWTVIYVIFLLGLRFLRRLWNKFVRARISAWVKKLEAGSGKIIDASSALAVQRLLSRATWITVVALATFFYAGRVLNEFALTKAVAGFLLGTLAVPFISFLKTGADELPNLLILGFIYLLARFSLKLTHLVFSNIEAGIIKLEGFDRRWVWPTHRIAHFAITISAIVIAFPYIPGAQTPAFQGATVLLGLMLTLGANSIASNFLSGLVVVYKRTVNVGDRINVGETIGVVESMSVLDTHLRTFENELVSIPNSVILASEVVNLTQTEGTNGLLIKVAVGIGYDENPEFVEELLLTAASKVNYLKRTPKPFVLTSKLGNHDVTYELHAYLKSGSRRIVARSHLNRAILDAFNSVGVQIMTPFYTSNPQSAKIPN
jgi:small-conductance mechanosensitive channel